MRRLGLTLALLLLLSSTARAATVVVAWNPSPSPEVTGYRVQYGTASGIWPQVVDVGPALTARVTLDPGRYYFTVVAYSPQATSPPAAEVAATILATDPCAFPLGATSVSIFVTGKLNKTGSGGPGSRAFITFQAASPNSPITFLSVRANGIDLPDAVTEGTNLRAIGSLWFTIPPGVMGYAVYGKNAAGCAREQPTGFSTGP
jgi:hypothetical protein